MNQPTAGKAATSTERLLGRIAPMPSAWRGEPAEPSGTVVGPSVHTPGGRPVQCAAQGPEALAGAVRWAAGFQGCTTNGERAAMSATLGHVTTASVRPVGRAFELGVSCFFALGEGALERLRATVGPDFGFADPGVQARTVESCTIASARGDGPNGRDGTEADAAGWRAGSAATSAAIGLAWGIREDRGGTAGTCRPASRRTAFDVEAGA